MADKYGQSGTLITAGFAVKLGKPVLVVPGPITSEQSAASTALLKSGATLVGSVQDVLAELPIKVKDVKSDKKLNWSEIDQKVWDLVGQKAMNSDELARELKINMVRLMEVMTILELSGVVMHKGDAWMVKKL